MLVLIATLLVLIPAVAVLYPFVRKSSTGYLSEELVSPRSELHRRWEETLSELRSVDMDRDLGNITEADYRLLREAYLADAARLMKALEVEEQREQGIMAEIESYIRQARTGMEGEERSRPIEGSSHQPGAAAPDDEDHLSGSEDAGGDAMRESQGE